MTSQEKAMELIIKFYKVETITGVSYMTIHQAKECAKIAVNEIIDAIDWHVTDTPNGEFIFWDNVLAQID
jgi:hypothetical protein